jgi:hypothetical protein
VKLNPFQIATILPGILAGVAGMTGGSYLAPAARGFHKGAPNPGSGGGKSRVRRQRRARARASRRAERRMVKP